MKNVSNASFAIIGVFVALTMLPLIAVNIDLFPSTSKENSYIEYTIESEGEFLDMTTNLTLAQYNYIVDNYLYISYHSDLTTESCPVDSYREDLPPDLSEESDKISINFDCSTLTIRPDSGTYLIDDNIVPEGAYNVTIYFEDVPADGVTNKLVDLIPLLMMSGILGYCVFQFKNNKRS